MALTNIHIPRLFQIYLDNCFKFPKDLRNDIIYCQRALKAHIRVHQMVLEVFETQEDPDPTHLHRIIEELENEIYEVNAEQHYLFLRLRRVIDKFSKTLSQNNIPFDPKIMNALIARDVVPFVADESMEIYPMTVQFRDTEEKLLEKYLVVQRENKTYEIIDSDDEEHSHVVLITDEDMAQGGGEPSMSSSENLQSDGVGAASKNPNTNNLTQMSLLKPMAQRMVGNTGNVADASQFLQMSIVEEKGINEMQGAGATATAELSAATSSTTANSEVPITVKMCRLNLQKALNKAFNENKSAAKAAASLTATTHASPHPSNGTAATTSTTTSTVIVSTARTTKLKRKSNSKTPSPPPQTIATSSAAQVAKPKKMRITRKSNANVVATTSTASALNKEVSGESNPSEDSNSNPPTPSTAQTATWPFTIDDIRAVKAEQAAKETYLHTFLLYKKDQLEKLQQRRSKRTKRTVHSNEQADFHYGSIDYGNAASSPEKKRKTKFLLSQRDKLNKDKDTLPNSRNAEKNGEAAGPSRSTSSSPDEKRCCNECLKSGNGCLDQCPDCQGFYHQACHFEEDDDTPTSTARLSKLNKLNKLKLCPACKRRQIRLLREETKQFKNLHNTAQQLEKKLAKEKDRNASLQKASKMYKIQMQNLFNIVNAIKSDQENENDSNSE